MQRVEVEETGEMVRSQITHIIIGTHLDRM